MMRSQFPGHSWYGQHRLAFALTTWTFPNPCGTHLSIPVR